MQPATARGGSTSPRTIQEVLVLLGLVLAGSGACLRTLVTEREDAATIFMFVGP
jgi:hypothetical protein